MATASASLIPLLLLFARLSALTVALLVLIWALGFKTSSLTHSPNSELLIYDVNPHTLFVYAQHIFASAPSIANGDWVHSHQWRSDFGAQMVAGFKKFEEIGAFVSSRSGFGLWDFWDLDEIPWARWDLANGFLELLAQRGEANDKGSSLALAHLPGSIYLWLSRASPGDDKFYWLPITVASVQGLKSAYFLCRLPNSARSRTGLGACGSAKVMTILEEL
ncbi:hypothetical protein RHSIM_Rhsim09G0113300 [Rhododendron simsii]|uniref:Uncharacterized protein n=1 Tax=Rhododendron simsii TaxID=118357 RepID=A0A834GHG7_RHOSS|nr:hypothetical protein RHSIM_Rhsim09G0113300 [Rhododendron simsii]